MSDIDRKDIKPGFSRPFMKRALVAALWATTLFEPSSASSAPNRQTQKPNTGFSGTESFNGGPAVVTFNGFEGNSSAGTNPAGGSFVIRIHESGVVSCSGECGPVTAGTISESQAGGAPVGSQVGVSSSESGIGSAVVVTNPQAANSLSAR